MQPSTASLIDRPDTFLGVCEGLGQDFGFNPIWLRIGFGGGVLWNPVAMIAIYAVLGVAVLVSRLAFPDRAAATAPTTVAEDRPEPMRMAA